MMMMVGAEREKNSLNGISVAKWRPLKLEQYLHDNISSGA